MPKSNGGPHLKVSAEEKARKQDYSAHINSAAWKTLRKRVFARAGRFCEQCGILVAKHCHHKTYARFGHEELGDLEALCEMCHGKIHGIEFKIVAGRRVRRLKRKKLSPKQFKREKRLKRRRNKVNKKLRHATSDGKEQRKAMREFQPSDIRERIVSGAYFRATA